MPYEFFLNDEFSHCGVDIFTLRKKDGEWRIILAAYTVENDGCEDLKGK